MESLPQNFEAAVLPHLDAAYNLARWLIRDETEAEDVVQEAFLRAFKYFPGFRGSNGRPWLLAIVRNTCHTWMRRRRVLEVPTSFDEEMHNIIEDQLNPETLLLKEADVELVRQAVEELPVEFREVIVLREIEGLTYKQIAEVEEIPIGTVMSRLMRARKRLQLRLGNKQPAAEPAVVVA